MISNSRPLEYVSTWEHVDFVLMYSIEKEIGF